MNVAKKVALFAFAVMLIASTPRGTVAAVATRPPQIVWAERLVREVAADRNMYGSHPTIVRWIEDGAGPAINRSVCSAFVTHVLRRAYGFDDTVIRRWFGSGNPHAIDYAHAIGVDRGFDRVSKVSDIRRGDIVAIAYPPGSVPTGHVMFADGPAAARVATAPIEPGLRQYEIVVIDSSHSWHGPADTRAASRTSGVGEGTVRIYAGPDGAIAGYSWSTRGDSQFYTNDKRRMVVGRLTAPPSDAVSIHSGGTDDTDGGAVER
jgi:hypothetical protein